MYYQKVNLKKKISYTPLQLVKFFLCIFSEFWNYLKALLDASSFFEDPTHIFLMMSIRVSQIPCVFEKNIFERIEQKGMTFDHDFWYSFSFSSSLFFLGGKIKGEKNDQSRGQKSCLSAGSFESCTFCHIMPFAQIIGHVGENRTKSLCSPICFVIWTFKFFLLNTLKTKILLFSYI